MTTDEVTTGDVTTDEVTTGDITTDEVTTGDVITNEVTTAGKNDKPSGGATSTSKKDDETTGKETPKEDPVEDPTFKKEYNYSLLKTDDYRNKLGLTDAQKKALDEVYGKATGTKKYYFSVAKIAGFVPADFKRITLEEFEGEIFEKLKTIYNDDSVDSNQKATEAKKIFTDRQKWSDLTWGSGVTWYAYWFNDEGTEGVKFVYPVDFTYFKDYMYADLDKFQSELEDTGSTYTVKLETIIDTDTLYSESYQNSIGLTDAQKQKLNALKPEVSSGRYTRHVADEMELLGKIPNDFKPLTLAEAEKIIEDSKKIAGEEQRKEYIITTLLERQYPSWISYNDKGEAGNMSFALEDGDLNVTDEYLRYVKKYVVN